ncbi:MAG: hypothetical protein CFE31_09720 [Rhizobiales bacterium PAR1]|nr:MAG: hypothetical protein CFE31_09720 [Rhizobiales bacterium PAR1]
MTSQIFREYPASALAPIHASLRRIAGAVSWTVAFGVLLAIGGSIYSVMMPRTISSFIGLGDACTPQNIAMNGVRLRLFFAFLPGLVLFGVIAVQVRALFRRFSLGVILDQGNARRLSTIGWLIIAGGAISMLERTLLALALTFGNPEGQRQLLISLSTTDVIIVLFGLFVLAFAHVIGEGARIADENRGFV